MFIERKKRTARASCLNEPTQPAPSKVESVFCFQCCLGYGVCREQIARCRNANPVAPGGMFRILTNVASVLAPPIVRHPLADSLSEDKRVHQ